MLKIENLTKQYGNTLALNRMCLEMDHGVYGVLGPNGAGKSTFMKVLTLTIKPTEGRILFKGKDIEGMGKDFLKILGYVPQQQPLYTGFTAREFLYYIADLKGIGKNQMKEETEELLKFVHLSEEGDKKIGHFSGGMKQRLLIAQSLLGNPRLVLLDEPTAGVDPMERIFIRKLIKNISSNRIIIITTHILSDIESIADAIVMMNKGKIVHYGTKGDILQNCGAETLEDAYMKVFGGLECIDH